MIPVIIPYYKNKENLDRCISHLNNQTVQVEIFVRDNNKENVYFTAAVNEGIRKYLDKSCEYIVILNQDMYLDSFALENMKYFMDNNPLCGISVPLQLDYENPDFVIFAGGKEAFPSGMHQNGPLSEFNRNEMILWGNGACMMLRKKMIEEIGLLDKNYLFIGSDSDYCFTARSRGWKIWRIANAKGFHQGGDSGESSDINIELIKIKDMMYFGNKWLTPDLYKDLSYEGQKLNIEKIDSIMHELKETQKELESIYSNVI
jgi:GT2 family glycosyltransferase